MISHNANVEFDGAHYNYCRKKSRNIELHGKVVQSIYAIKYSIKIDLTISLQSFTHLNF